MHYPESASGQRELERRVAAAHAQAVVEYIRKLSCPAQQKTAFLEAVVQLHKTAAGE